MDRKQLVAELSLTCALGDGMDAWDNEKNGKGEGTENTTAHERIVQHGEVVVSEQLVVTVRREANRGFRVLRHPLTIGRER